MKKQLAFRVFIVASMPLAYALAAAWQIWGRYFMPNHEWWADPEHTYLFSGLLLSTGTAPWFMDHPGVPLKAVNAFTSLFVWKSNLVGTASLPFAESVVSQAESHIVAVTVLLSLTVTVASSLSGWRWYPVLGPTLTPLSQLAPLLSVYYFPTIFAGNRPEVLIMAFSYFSFAIISPLFEKSPKKISKVGLLLLGIFLGAAVATKLSFFFVALFLPLILANLKRIAFVYSISTITFLIFLSPLLTRLPAFIGMSIAKNQREGSLIEALKSLSEWLWPKVLEPFSFILIYLILVCATFLALLIHQAQSSKFKNLRWISSQSNRSLRLLLVISLLVIICQSVVFMSRWFSWFIIPVFPIITLSSAVALLLLLTSLSRRPSSLLGISLASALVSWLIISTVIALQKTYPLDAAVPPSSFQIEINQNAATAVPVVYDYSITWSHSPLGTLCTSLINGDAFAREIAADLVRQKCPQVGLAGFGEDRILPLAPFLNLAPDENLQHALYCQDLQRLKEKPGGLSIVTPARDFDYIKAETVVEEGGWRLSRVIEIDCTGSLVRNERPSPATLAARERVSNLPIVGPIYRNWPFRDEIARQ